MGKKKIVTTVVAAFFGLAGGAWAQGQTQGQAQTQQQTQISQQQLQAKCIQAKSNLQQAQLQLQQANATLQALQGQGTADKQLQQAQEQVQKAESSVHVAQRELRLSEQDLNQLRAQQQRLQEQQQQRTAQLEQQQQKAQAKARACDALKQVATVRQEARGIVVTLAAPLLFKFDEASLMPTAEKQLDAVANALTAAQEPIVIEGFTDSVGTQAYNEKLSNERAQSVRDYLIQQGVPPQQIQGTEGLGEQHPVASNDTSTGRANNRRVEIVLPNFEQAQGAAVGGAGQAGGPTQQGAGPHNQKCQPPMQNQ